MPDKILTNEDLEKFVDTSDEWITTRTGIKERRIASDTQSTSDLASAAAIDAMSDAVCDGLVFHPTHTTMLDVRRMRKWKPRHTVDLKVSSNLKLRTRSMTVQSVSTEHQTKCQKGDVWEFEFSNETLVLTPVRKRTDKDMPNSDQTYRDVRRAHQEQITEADLRNWLQ